MVYVALLRGINVGGNHKVEMSRLKAVFESIGYCGITTYINSGNVIFSSDMPESSLAGSIESAIEKEFGFNVPVIVRSKEVLRKTAESINDTWQNNTQMKTDVMFLWGELDSPDILKNIVMRPEVENVVYTPGALIWNVDRVHIANGAEIQLSKSSMYRKMTVRNCNTVRKLLDMMG